MYRAGCALRRLIRCAWRRCEQRDLSMAALASHQVVMRDLGERIEHGAVIVWCHPLWLRTAHGQSQTMRGHPVGACELPLDSGLDCDPARTLRHIFCMMLLCLCGEATSQAH